MIVDIVIRETPEGEVIHYLLSEDEREFDLRGLLFEDEVTDCDWLDEEQRFPRWPLITTGKANRISRY